MDLDIALKSTGKSQVRLSEETRIAQPDISKMARGEKFMSEGMAERLARHLPGTTPDDLLIGNKTAAFKRAQERGDRVGVLKTAEAIVKHVERLPEDPELERALDKLVDTAVKFAQGDSEEYDQEPGRDILGRRVNKSTATPTDEGAYPLWQGHQATPTTAEDLEDEDEGYDDLEGEGRDAYGIRVRPLGERE